MLTGSHPLTDITASGTAQRIAGSDDESGTVTLKVLSSGATRLDFNFPSGPRSEFRSALSDGPTGGWSGPDSVVHTIADHNLFNDWAWSPAFTVASATSQTSVLILVGNESRSGQAVVHLSYSRQSAQPSSKAAGLIQHLSQVDIFLDATTLLPASIAYNVHPDDNALLDIPVELHFSDYRSVNGARIPFRIQKFLNNSLVLDLQFQSVALNTGLTATQVGGAQ